MRNPYEVLGLDSTANMDEVKRAYRELAKQYNEDYARMDELNAAYDTIVMNFGNNRQSNSYSDTNSQYSYNSDPADGVSEFGDIRAKLNNGRIDDAEMLLDHLRITVVRDFCRGKLEGDAGQRLGEGVVKLDGKPRALVDLEVGRGACNRFAGEFLSALLGDTAQGEVPDADEQQDGREND